jgi:hypothetical protein
MEKPLVFISHITEEKEITLALQDLVKQAFLDMIDVFVSSDPTSIGLGKKWLNAITEALKDCSVQIILASPESVTRPWINFEAGAAWIRDIEVIPLCHSGITPSHLPSPLSALQSAVATEVNGLKQIFPLLAKALSCKPPEIDFSGFIKVVNDFEATSRKFEVLKSKSTVPPTAGLSDHEVAALSCAGAETFVPGGTVTVHNLRGKLERAGHTAIAISLSLRMLNRKDLIDLVELKDDWGNETPNVRVTDEGWTWLEANTIIDAPKRRRSRPAEQPPSAPSSGDSEIPF